MFKQLKDSGGQNVVNRSSMGQFGFTGNGVRVRDPSQMFVFGDTNREQQTGLFGFSNSFSKSFKEDGNGNSLGTKGFKHLFAKTDGLISFQSGSCSDENRAFSMVKSGSCSNPWVCNKLPHSQLENPKTGGCDAPNTSIVVSNASGNKEVSKSECHDASTPSCDDNNNNGSHAPYVGLRLIPQSQRPHVNYFDPSRISHQPDQFAKPYQSPKSEKNQLSSPNRMTSHLVSVKKADDRVVGHRERLSTSNAPKRRIRKRSSVRAQQLDDAANLNTRSLKSKKRRLRDISTAGRKRARKQLKGFEEPSDSCRKRRLSLTTQLMQMLFQLPPANVLSEDAITHCDIVTYYAAKLALDDACRLCTPAGKKMTSKSSNDQDLLEVIEGFIDRSKRLEVDVLRLEKKREPLFLEVMMDFQDLDKISFVNRFAKLHSRGPAVTGERSSSTMQKPYPQRHVNTIPMPKMMPEGQDCVFL